MSFENAGQRSRRPAEGQSVVSLSGRRLGTVVEVVGEAFCMEHEHARIWLASEAVFTVDGGLVSLVCEVDDVQFLAVQMPQTYLGARRKRR